MKRDTKLQVIGTEAHTNALVRDQDRHVNGPSFEHTQLQLLSILSKANSKIHNIVVEVGKSTAPLP